jgi:hypothetical protein
MFLFANCQSLSAQQSGKKGKTKVAEATPSSPTAAAKLNHTQLAKFIDEQVNARLKQNEVAASAQCTDGEFIRRVYLDIAGVIPPAERVAEFLDSKDPNKRAKLIDELLESPRYGKYFGEIWANAIVPTDSTLRRLSTTALESWLAERFNNNTAWDKIVHDIITAEGAMTEKNGATTFFVANPSADKLTDKTTQLFLGVQLQCAQCHNHPFTDYKQNEYWAMAAFFMNTRINGNPNQAAKKGNQITITESATGKKMRLPLDAKIVPAKFLSGPEANLNKKEPYRPILADWVTSKENRFFAKAISNKLWYHFHGRAIVNPVDDMHDDNPATHPELLAGLADQMKVNNFDLKYMIRAICNSETYQRSSRPTGNNGDDQELFSHALVRNMTPEQLYDSLEAVIKSETASNAPRGKKVNKNQRNNNARSQFVLSFGLDSGFNPLEYQAGIPQALRLMNSRQINTTQGIVAQAMKASKAPEGVVEYLYLATVSRRPSTEEMTRLTTYVGKQSDPRAAYGDIAWALLNSSEFALNH